MTEAGNMIVLEIGEAEADLRGLPAEAGRRCKVLRIEQDGKPVAHIVPAGDPLPPEAPRLKVTFAPGFDPTQPLADDEWPGRFR